MGCRANAIQSINEITHTGGTSADGTIECGARFACGNEGPGSGIGDGSIGTGIVDSITSLEVVFNGRVDIT